MNQKDIQKEELQEIEVSRDLFNVMLHPPEAELVESLLKIIKQKNLELEKAAIWGGIQAHVIMINDSPCHVVVGTERRAKAKMKQIQAEYVANIRNQGCFQNSPMYWHIKPVGVEIGLAIGGGK